MITRLYRPLLMGLLPLALIACVSPAPTVAEEGAAVPLGIDLGGSGPVIASAPSSAPALHAGTIPHPLRTACRWRMRGTTTRMGPAPSIPSIPRNTS